MSLLLWTRVKASNMKKAWLNEPGLFNHKMKTENGPRRKGTALFIVTCIHVAAYLLHHATWLGIPAPALAVHR